jgi:hypothetical protein
MWVFHFVSDHAVSPAATIKLVWSSYGFSYYLDKSNQDLNKVRRHRCIPHRYYDPVFPVETHQCTHTVNYCVSRHITKLMAGNKVVNVQNSSITSLKYL